jgi:predicted PurR-regulated permease PerM
MRARLRRRRGGEADAARTEDEYVEIDPGELAGVFAAPGWLRDAGLTAWLLVGLTVLVVGLVWLIALTHVIVMPLIAAGIAAAVGSPLVAWMKRHGVPRGLGAIGAGALFGAAGLILAAPLTSAIVKITADLSRAQGDAKAPAEPDPAPT